MKYDIEIVKQIFASKGYVLLANEWHGNRTPLLSKCICGKECKLSLRAIQRGSKCKDCQYESTGKKKGFSNRLKLTHDEVVSFFKEQRCELLEEYKGCQTPMSFRCSCGNIAKIRWDHFKNGTRCSKCRRGVKTSIEEVKKIFSDNNCELLSTEYKDSKEKVQYRCKCGKICQCLVSTMKYQKIHCKECGLQKHTGSNCSFYIKDREALSLRNKFKKRCYKMIEHTLNMTGKKKDGHTYELLGYSPKDLQIHIESYSDWEKLKDQKWTIDHIFPISAFIDLGITDIKIINGLDNLQPLIGKDNSIKNAKYNKEEFKLWLKTKGIV